MGLKSFRQRESGAGTAGFVAEGSEPDELQRKMRRNLQAVAGAELVVERDSNWWQATAGIYRIRSHLVNRASLH